MADQTVNEKVVFKKYHLSFVEKIRKSGNFNETVLTGLGAGSTFTGTNRTSSSTSSVYHQIRRRVHFRTQE